MRTSDPSGWTTVWADERTEMKTRIPTMKRSGEKTTVQTGERMTKLPSGMARLQLDERMEAQKDQRKTRRLDEKTTKRWDERTTKWLDGSTKMYYGGETGCGG